MCGYEGYSRRRSTTIRPSAMRWHVCTARSWGCLRWRAGPTGCRFASAALEITHEHEWNEGRRSFYFNDPAGNLLEIADGDLWPEASANFT